MLFYWYSIPFQSGGLQFLPGANRAYFAYICASFARRRRIVEDIGERIGLHKAGAGGEVARRGRCGRMIKSFRAPARVTLATAPKSDQKVCLKPKVSRLPARYGLWLSIVCTARSRDFFFIVRSKDRLCVCAAAADLCHGRSWCVYVSERRGGVLPRPRAFRPLSLSLPPAGYFLSLSKESKPKNAI